MPEPVLYRVDKHMALITLNRPEKRNALNQALLAAIYDAVEAGDQNRDIRVIVITGQDPAFCAGLDLQAVTRENLLDPRSDGRDLPDIFGACRKPIIAAVNGPAITGGFELALNCDFMIASENAQFADTHLRVGIHPGWGMTQHLQQAVGRRRARKMSYSAEPISARTAHTWGLVNEVVPHAELPVRIAEVATQIAQADQDMLQTVRALIDYRDQVGQREALQHEREGFKAFVGQLFRT